MEQINVPAGLRQLSGCIEQIRSLLAWIDLKKAETRAPGSRPFEIDRDTAQDLVNEIGQFVATSLDIHEALRLLGPKLGSERARARWRRKLLHLEAEFRTLDVNERFIRP
jgi:hypothetical protein